MMRISAADGEVPGGLGSLPTQIFDAVKDNIVVQWFLVVVVILIVGTQTAEKLSGPIGKIARWARSFGEERENREAAERRSAREKLLRDAKEGREYVQGELADQNLKIEELYDRQDKLDRLIAQHQGWDYEVREKLIGLGVKPAEIPTPPPLRVPWSTPTRAEKARHRAAAEQSRGDEDSQMVGAPTDGS